MSTADPTLPPGNTGTAVAERPAEEALAQTPWVTIVWDDPVNLMSYVTHVFRSYFNYPKEKAEKLMLTGVISYVLGDAVTLVSSAEVCAKQTWKSLAEHGLERAEPRTGRHRFVTTGSTEQFALLGRRLMGDWITDVAQLV